MTWKERFSLSILFSMHFSGSKPQKYYKTQTDGGRGNILSCMLMWGPQLHGCSRTYSCNATFFSHAPSETCDSVSTCVFLGNGLGVGDHKSVPHRPMNHWIVWCINQWQVASGSTRFFIWAESFPLFSYIWVQLIVVMLIWCWVNLISSCFLWFPSGCPLLYFFLPSNSPPATVFNQLTYMIS